MAYFTGLQPQQMGSYGAGLTSTYIPNSPTAQPVASGKAPVGGASIQPGMVSAPNSVLQNINNYSGSTGSLMGNANIDQGLRNYQAASNQYGGGIGQWNPWALTQQSAGGYGANPMSAGDLFVHPGNAQNFAQGNQYSLNGSNLLSQSINHNAYSGQTTGYGDPTYSRQSSPIGSDFWGLQTGDQRANGHVDYNGIQQNLNDSIKAYISKNQAAYSGNGNSFVAPKMDQLTRQLVMGSRPTGQQDSNGPLNAWYQYAHHMGYADNPYSYYAGMPGANLGTIAR